MSWRSDKISISSAGQLPITGDAALSSTEEIRSLPSWLPSRLDLKSFLALLVSGRLRLFPQFETFPWAIQFSQTAVGRVFLLGILCLLLMPTGYPWLLTTLGAAACAYSGQYRRWALAAVTLLCLSLWPYRVPDLTMLVAVLGFCVAIIFLSLHLRKFLIFRWPVLSLHILLVGLVLIGSAGILQGEAQAILWAFLIALCGYFWFLAYAVRDQGKDRWAVLAQLGTFYPFWGSRPIPYGKGAAYLRKFEATNAEELAITQIKGAKLLLWAYILKAIHVVFITVSHDILDIPTFDEAFEKHALGTPYSWHASWGAVVTNYCEKLLTLAYSGHIIIAIARFAGFRLLRNTYRPLTSRTLAEFWNRYYFYFKELLVEFYYYPTFFQCFKKHKRLRLLFATFMAAGVGNAFYHFFRDIHYVQSMGLIDAVIAYQTYIFYCLVLSLSIGFSQLRPHRDPSTMSPFRRNVLAPLGVATFFCILLIFSYAGRQYSLAQHFLFLFHLFGGL
jgi:hypothetical protein